uniref:Uncharacterized protein n=1 Tax=Sphaerodactylus townsendi TaxID=933632 RepID=A0ACB8EH41_9SAUR
MTMGDKKSPTRPKRQAKPAADEGFWDCSVCTFRNSAEAFKCSICDVRKGTSTRFQNVFVSMCQHFEMFLLSQVCDMLFMLMK